jgi:hypothetical protein
MEQPAAVEENSLLNNLIELEFLPDFNSAEALEIICFDGDIDVNDIKASIIFP